MLSHDAVVTGPGPSVRIRAFLLLVLLVVPFAVPAADAGYRQVHVTETEVVGRTVTLIAPAVAELPDGTLRGVGMEMQVTVRDGQGGVYVDTRPLTQVDMQGSARLAATMASAISGEDMGDHDFFVTTRASAPAVGGPSAGAAMTVAFTALLLDLPVRDDVVMTGMINPDGSVGPVGGILEKAQAADAAGAELFLIPEGQAIVRQTIREVEEDGWFPTVTTREEQIDVREHAQNEWDLEVREVADVYHAIEAATDHRIARPDVPDVAAEPLFGGVMAEASQNQLEEGQVRLARLEARLDGRARDDDAAGTADQLQALLERAATRLASAQTAYDNGSYYTASSRTFQASIDLRIVSLWLRTLDADDDRAFLQAEGRRAAERLDATRTNASAVAPETVSSLEAVGAAQVRVLEAARLLDQAEAFLGDDRLVETVETLAFGIERTRSVEWWLDIAETLAAEDDGAPLAADPDDLATDYFGIAQQAVTYAEVLLSQTGVDAATGRLLQEAALSLEAAQTARQEGLDVGALYLAMEAQVAGHGALSLVGSTGLIEDRIQRQRDRALIQIAQTREIGAEPFLAVSYLEFAESLETDQPVDALMMYGNAATIAATSGVLATGEVCGFGTASCAGAAPSLERVRVPGPDPWTAYFALGTVILGFMAGVLVALVVLQNRDRRQSPHARGQAPPAPSTSGRSEARRTPARRRAAVPPMATPLPRGAAPPTARVRLHYASRSHGRSPPTQSRPPS